MKKMINFGMPALRIAVFAGLLFAVAASAQTGGDDTLVMQFYPSALTSESVADFGLGGPPPFTAYDYRYANLDGPGSQQYIVAAFSNGFSGRVAVLRKQGSSAMQVAAPDFPLMGGVRPTVALYDVEGDGKPEVLISFTAARGSSADWLLKWDGSTLRSIGPAVQDAQGNIATSLVEADFVDINGDGILEIINAPETTNGVFQVFKLSNGSYENAGVTIDAYYTFARGSGAPKNEVRTFSVANHTAPHLVTIVNGDITGLNRVSSAVIRLNGVSIAGPERFSQKVLNITIPVSVTGSNTLEVELRSEPGSQLSIAIGPR